MINIFSKQQIINITIVVGQCVVDVNGTRLMSGTANQCMSKLRSMLSNYYSDSFYSNSVIKININTEAISAEVADDKSYFLNQIKLLSTSCKCRFEINSGIHYIG